jgi:glycosyltransferase involved in cell wall biosynthesis
MRHIEATCTVQPKVSVLMCAHNSAGFIRNSIDSILEQSYSDFELIIVENGSTDETFDIASSYKDERICVYRSSLKQLTYNLNFGLERCRGQYIARMDSDDIADPERLKVQVSFLDEHPNVDFVGCYMKTFGEKKSTVRYPLTNRWIAVLAPIRTILAHPTVMGKRDAFLYNGGYQGMKYSEDLDMWLSSMRAGKVLANIPLTLLDYRIHEGQSRGKREAYASAAATLLKHFLLTKNPLFLFGAVVAGVKTFVLGQ